MKKPTKKHYDEMRKLERVRELFAMAVGNRVNGKVLDGEMGWDNTDNAEHMLVTIEMLIRKLRAGTSRTPDKHLVDIACWAMFLWNMIKGIKLPAVRCVSTTRGTCVLKQVDQIGDKDIAHTICGLFLTVDHGRLRTAVREPQCPRCRAITSRVMLPPLDSLEESDR